MASQNLNLYNKYRPKSFSEIIGQEVVKKLLLNILNHQKLLQSFLFYGSHGTGKTSMARIFAKAWNCEKFAELGDICNECQNCKLINDYATIDLCEVDAASHTGVDNVREIIHNSQYMPLDLNKKIYMMDECHLLSNSAWNALLKTIEEPPSEHVIFIFLTTNIAKVPETILSRCQKYNFASFSGEELRRVMSLVSKGEKKNFDEDAIKLLINLSQGSARECISLMEQAIQADNPDPDNITLSDIENIFALANKEEQLQFLELLIGVNETENRQKLIQIVEDLSVQNKHLLNYFSSLLCIVMDLYVYELTKDLTLMKRVNETDVKRLANRGLDCLSICEKLSKALREFSIAHSKTDWAKLTLFQLMSNRAPSTAAPVAPTPTKPIVPTKATPDLSVPQEIELKFLYNTLEDKRDAVKSKENYETYATLKSKRDLNPELKKVLFQKGIVFPNKQMLTTDKTILLLFKDAREADAFNSVVKQGSEYEKALNELFIGNYFWWAATIEQMKFYKTKPKPGREDIIKSFASDKDDEEIFENLLSILES